MSLVAIVVLFVVVPGYGFLRVGTSYAYACLQKGVSGVLAVRSLVRRVSPEISESKPHSLLGLGPVMIPVADH
jgi:hypothetical protein